MERRLWIGFQMRGPVPRLTVHGDLDRATAAELREYVEHVTSTFPTAIELDLAGVGRVDDAGIRALAALRRRLRRRLRVVPGAAVARAVRSAAESARSG